MSRNELSVSRISSATSSSNDSTRSSVTIKPHPASPTASSSAGSFSSTDRLRHSNSGAGSRTRGLRTYLDTDYHGTPNRSPIISRGDVPVSPTTTVSPSSRLVSSTTSPSMPPSRDRRLDLGNYRHDLSAVDGGSNPGRNASNSRTSLPTVVTPLPQMSPAGNNASFYQAAPWLAGGGGGGSGSGTGASTPASAGGGAYAGIAFDSSRHAGYDAPDATFFSDDRRPSAASVATTASSQGSKTSDRRAAGMRKLQGIFGEEFPGRDLSDASLPNMTTAGGKDQRSHSYSRPHRDRNYSNATDRDASSSSSRPRTPLPDREVVPFLYQEPDDIARYGEAPVRDTLTGPDRERFVTDSPAPLPPKTSSSSRSGHSIAHLPHHIHHRHNKSNEDPRSLHPSVSREESIASIRDRVAPAMYASRAQSPTPSGTSGSGSFSIPKAGIAEDQVSTSSHHHHHHLRKGLLGRLRRSRGDKDDAGAGGGSHGGSIGSSHGLAAQLKKVSHSHSSRNLNPRPSRQELPRADSVSAPFFSPDVFSHHLPSRFNGDREPPISTGPRQVTATFNNKFPFSKKTRTQRHLDDYDESIGPTDRVVDGTKFDLDTDLNDMTGIISRPLPLTPMDADVLRGTDSDRGGTVTPRVDHYYRKKPSNASGGSAGAAVPAVAGPNGLGFVGPGGAGPGGPGGPNGSWNAPDSWGVRRTTEDVSAHVPDTDDAGNLVQPEEKNYYIRVFKADGTFFTVQNSLMASVQDLIVQLSKRVFTESQNYQIVLKRHGAIRVLAPADRPLLLQKRLLQQIGYEQRDHLTDLGREDNSYLCRFIFLADHESDFQSQAPDFGQGRVSKIHVDLSGRNLITIPISLYSKANEIISLNLSRNLSLDVPRDFIQSCVSLRDIKYNNNEARRVPPSLGRSNHLTFLDVSNNRIETLEDAELEDITAVLKLNFANNRLKQLPTYFSAYHALRTLNMSSNFLDTFPSFLCDLESLIDLDLSFNLIVSLPDDIGRLRNLERFVITNNRLSGTLPAGFQNLQNLRELDIKYNAITRIDVISKLPKLEILTADHNAISQFVGSFERLRSLKLNANPITRFELDSPLPTLKVLNLSNAQLASIANSFNNMRNLERLHLDKNYFVSLPNQLGNLARLETFSIANNSVGELPPEIGCLKELRVLDVRDNNIRKLPMEIWWANKLETLNASSNVLENFPKPASRPPQAPGESGSKDSMSAGGASRLNSTVGTLSSTPSSEELDPDDSRRPSQASSTLLSVGPSPVLSAADRKNSVVSVYGKGGRKTSVVSRATAPSSGMATPIQSRKDSGLSSRNQNTFSGSLRNLYLADNQLDDDVFEQLTLLGELRVLNMSYNDLADMPQRCMRSWPYLVELYLSGNELTTLPADDLGDASVLQVLHINGNKFTNLPADISRARNLAVLDCGSNLLKYNISNVPYDWNWNLNPNLRYLNLSGNRRLEIKQTVYGAGAAAALRQTEKYADFNRLQKLRVLGLMDVTLTQPSVPEQSEDRRVRTSGSMAGFLPYGMADTLGRNEHLSTIDLVVPRFMANVNESYEQDILLCLFDGQELSSGGSKVAKYLHENFSRVFSTELKNLSSSNNETIEDGLRRAFLTLNKDLITSAIQADDRLPLASTMVPHRGSIAPMVLTKEDLNSGGVATVAYLQGQELYVANIGDVQAMLIQSDGSHKMLTRKHDPAEPGERSRIRDAGGWVSRNGRLNDMLSVSRAFGYADLMPAVMAAPNVTHHTVSEQDETVILATREVWEYLSPGLVADVARQERRDLMRASQRLRDLAMAYGASGKIMVMMLSLSDLKRKSERSLLQHRGQSMSLYPSGIPEEATQQFPTRRGKRAKGDVLDSTLQRLDAEVPAPTGLISIVFTDIKSSTNLWETYPAAMRSAIRVHNDVMRRQLRYIGGFEVKTEGDAFMVSFPTATSALLWAFAVQLQLLDAPWPTEMLNAPSCQSIVDKDNNVIFRGLSVRMGIHWGEPLCEPDPITRRMDYYGPMVNKASRISNVADGGQIAVSSDFISEIQRCLETYQETGQGSVGGSDDGTAGGGSNAGFEDDGFAQAIRKELKTLSSQGFAVKEMGEIKLKGLENPEVVYSLYPHALAGRMEAHQQHERISAAVAAATVGVEGQAAQTVQASMPNSGGAGGMAGMDAVPTVSVSEAASGKSPSGVTPTPTPTPALILGDPSKDDLRVIPEAILALWQVSLRLEMLCSSLEQVGGSGLQPPETELLEQMKARGANVSERFMMNFLAHQISRIETCTTTLALRHMAMGGGPIHHLDDLRASMTDVFAAFQNQLDELRTYRARYGKIEEQHDEDDEDDEDDEEDEDEEDEEDDDEQADDDEGSDTEQE